jgi:hypothetical protein
MGVNRNPHVRVTAVIGDRSNNVHGRRFSRLLGNLMKRRRKAKASQNARLSRGGLRMS